MSEKMFTAIVRTAAAHNFMLSLFCFSLSLWLSLAIFSCPHAHEGKLLISQYLIAAIQIASNNLMKNLLYLSLAARSLLLLLYPRIQVFYRITYYYAIAGD
jgi:hypothetical protein